MAVFKTKNQGYKFLIATAAAGVLSFVHINSYFADTHKLNGLFTVATVVFAAATAFIVYTLLKMQKQDDSSAPKP